MPSPLVYAADFETTTDENDCRVWAYGIAKIAAPDKVKFGTSVIEFLRELVKSNSTVYFHNLKFDGMFIINALLEQGYEWSPNRRLAPREFSTLYSDTGKLYSINVRWSHKAVTEFRDSLKKLPLSVERMAKAFNLPEVKGELDYHAYRAPGHKLTREEKDYIAADVTIVARAVGETLAEGMNKLTIGADSLAEYKRIYGTKRFANTFPVLSDEWDDDIRAAYRGGYTYADKRHSGKVLETPGQVYDVNSLYPSVMRLRRLPYGTPTRGVGRPPLGDDRLRIFRVTMTARLRKNHLPIIQLKKSFQFHESEYLERIDEPHTVSVTNVDWEMWNKHYVIDVHAWHGYYEFDSALGLFDDYIDKWMDVKANSVGGKREIAKLHLNSLYGKFATSRDITGKYPILADDGSVKWVRGEKETRPPIYTAMGVFITSYARETMITAAQENYDIFAYCDTDSLHVLGEQPPKGISIHESELGAWKHEGNFDRAKYLRAKAYAERIIWEPKHGSIPPRMDVKLAGVPVGLSAKLSFDDLSPGTVIHGKLVPRNVPGGVVLKESPYEIKL